MLMILKIIGIIILSILAAALLIILLVLFLPIRYRAAGKYDAGGGCIEGKVSWFLRFISVDVRYKSGQPLAAKARILFITIFDIQKRESDGGRLKRRRRKKTLPSEPELSAASVDESDDDYWEDILEKTDFGEADAKESDFKDADIQEADVREPDETADNAEKTGFFKKIKKFFEKLEKFIDNIKFTFHKICDTIVKVRDNARYYWELWQEESTKQAFASCKRQLLRIWRHSSPRKYEAKLHLGFEDPSVMGNVLALWGMLYPFHLGRVDIIPEFDRKILEGSFKLTGRISVYVFLWAAWLFVTDKNIKRLRSRLFI